MFSQLAVEYRDSVLFVKVDTDDEYEFADNTQVNITTGMPHYRGDLYRIFVLFKLFYLDIFFLAYLRAKMPSVPKGLCRRRWLRT